MKFLHLKSLCKVEDCPQCKRAVEKKVTVETKYKESFTSKEIMALLGLPENANHIYIASGVEDIQIRKGNSPVYIEYTVEEPKDE